MRNHIHNPPSKQNTENANNRDAIHSALLAHPKGLTLSELGALTGYHGHNAGRIISTINVHNLEQGIGWRIRKFPDPRPVGHRGPNIVRFRVVPRKSEQ